MLAIQQSQIYKITSADSTAETPSLAMTFRKPDSSRRMTMSKSEYQPPKCRIKYRRIASLKKQELFKTGFKFEGQDCFPKVQSLL